MFAHVAFAWGGPVGSRLLRVLQGRPPGARLHGKLWGGARVVQAATGRTEHAWKEQEAVVAAAHAETISRLSGSVFGSGSSGSGM